MTEKADIKALLAEWAEKGYKCPVSHHYGYSRRDSERIQLIADAFGAYYVHAVDAKLDDTPIKTTFYFTDLERAHGFVEDIGSCGIIPQTPIRRQNILKLIEFELSASRLASSLDIVPVVPAPKYYRIFVMKKFWIKRAVITATGVPVVIESMIKRFVTKKRPDHELTAFVDYMEIPPEKITDSVFTASELEAYLRKIEKENE